jgi:hypothetical protein
MTLEAKTRITAAVLATTPTTLNREVHSTIDQVIAKWWQTGRQDGLRLTEFGDIAFQIAEIEFGDVPIKKIDPGEWYIFLLELSRKITCPYYIDKWTVRLYDSKIVMLITLYGSLEQYLSVIKLRK